MALNKISLAMLEKPVVQSMQLVGNVLTVTFSDTSTRSWALAADGSVDLSDFLTITKGDERYALKGEGGGGDPGSVDLSKYVRKDQDNTYSSPLQYIKYDVEESHMVCFGWTCQLKSFTDAIALSPGAFHGHGMGWGGTIWGISTEAWTGDQDGPPTGPVGEHILDSIEAAVISQYDKNTQPLIGVNSVFKNRPDTRVNGTPFLGKGGNRYNVASWAYWVSSQQRSSAGEYCGWSRGLKFDAHALDRTVDGKAIAVDMGDIQNPQDCTMFLFPDGTTQDSGTVAFKAECVVQETLQVFKYQKVRFTQKYNYGNGGSWDGNNNRFITTAKGVYRFDVCVDIHNPDATRRTLNGFVFVCKNGLPQVGGDVNLNVTNPNFLSTAVPSTSFGTQQDLSVQLSGSLDAVPGDFFEVWLLFVTDAGFIVAGHPLSKTYLCIEKAY